VPDLFNSKCCAVVQHGNIDTVATHTPVSRKKLEELFNNFVGKGSKGLYISIMRILDESVKYVVCFEITKKRRYVCLLDDGFYLGHRASNELEHISDFSFSQNKLDLTIDNNKIRYISDW